ncbi:hypothetical protein B9G55_11435 [Saccharibacillus sp. O16]|nr:hypothetical protein B9G55_11435 [Saccharibacillus sp. O16]
MKWSSKVRKTAVVSLAAALALSSGAASAEGVPGAAKSEPPSRAGLAVEQSAAGGVYSRLVVFKENQFPKDYADVLQEFTSVEAEAIPEVGMLKLSGSSAEDVQQAEVAVLKTFKDSIENIGSDPQLELPPGDKAVTDQAAAKILETEPAQGDESKNDKSKNDESETSKSNRTQMRSMAAEETSEAAGETQAAAAEVPLYEKWGWDIKEVTGDWKSYDIQRGSRDVVVAVIDSGIDASHPDLAASIVGKGRSFVPGVESTTDNLGHGTMVAGAITANGKLRGIGPDLGLVPYKVFDTAGADTSWVVEAIIQASKDDVDVINLSLGTYKSLLKSEDQAALLAYARALIYANLKGVTVVASSGTDGLDIGDPAALAKALKWEGTDLAVHAPGGLPGVITTSAYNRQHEKAYYSNYGLRDMIAAPAGDYGSTWFTKGELNITSMCLTTYPTQLPQSELSKLAGLPAGYEFMIGTSLAAPKVSASAGVLIAEARKQGKTLSPSAVKKALFESAEDYGTPGADKEFGAGGVNVYEALSRLSK